MNAIENVQAVIAANRAIQVEARRWNVRAGENIFPVMTSAEWREWLRPRLGGAVSCATISGPEALRLPELSPEKIAMVRDSNPDTIVVLGAELSVEYREPYYGTAKSPQITLGGEFVSSNRWIGLPDEGVRLPSGRAVNIVLKSASSYYALAEGSDIPILKKTMKDRLNEEAWKSFTDRPAITAPDLSDENVTLPEIATAVYGTCAVTGESLLAYGTITAYRSWSLDPVTWKAEWFRSRVDAESASGKAQAELEKSKVEAREKRLVAAARVAAEESQKNAGELYNRYCGDGSDVALGEELREKLYSRRYSRLPLTADELVRWKAETDAMIAEVEASVTAAIAKKAELEKRRLAGDLLLDFGGHFRVMGATGQAQYWVVAADGSLREPDTINYRKRYSEEGEKWWKVVEADELALSWHKAYTAADHEFAVNKKPAAGCTPAQLETAARLEEEIAERFHTVFGIYGSASAPFGVGWGLGSSKPKSQAPALEDAKPASLDALAALKAKWGAR